MIYKDIYIVSPHGFFDALYLNLGIRFVASSW